MSLFLPFKINKPQALVPLMAALVFLGSVRSAPAQADGTAGSALQGGVSALDSRPTMSVNVGRTAPNFVDNPPVNLRGVSTTERVLPEVFRAWLANNHSQFALNAQSLAPNLIIDVKGQWDHADRTLGKLGIPYTEIRTGDISAEALAGAKVMIINCAGGVKRERLQFIRDFVQRGGYLLTTDWALDNALDQTFPGYLAWDKAVNHRTVYSSTFVSPDPVLARGCVRNAPWKLDAGAHLVLVLKPDAVRVLVNSPDLSIEDPNGGGVLACCFAFGRGYVLHMVGHFDNNAIIAVGNSLPDPAPGIKISLRQALATNFIVAGLTGQTPGGEKVRSGGLNSGESILERFPSHSSNNSGERVRLRRPGDQ